MTDLLLSPDAGFVILQSAFGEGYVQWLGRNLTEALGIVANNIGYVLLGVITGMVIGTIPGMGGVVAVTILLPFTLELDPFQAFAMLSGAVGATTFSGSLTAILINTPGTSSNAATLIDGYPLTQKGESAMAITVSAISSATGAILAGIIFIAAIPLMIELVLLFGPSEIFWIVLFAIIVIPIMVATNPLYGILTAGMGAMFAFVGTSPQVAEPRFIFGTDTLLSGIPLLAMLIGFFAIAEIVRLSSLGRNTVVDFDKVNIEGSKIAGVKAVLEHKWLWLRCSLIGLIVGAIPGAGGSSAGFVAYAHAIQSSDHKGDFGKGIIEGVLAPESANDAKDGGQLFPTLGLGIPGSGTMAVFLGGLIMHGIFPGPSLLTSETHLVLVIAISIIISNISTSIIGIVLAKQFTRLLKVPIPLLLTAIVVLSLTAVFIVRNEFLDVGLALFFAVLGIILIRLEISRIPFLIAFILAGIMEVHYQLALQYVDGGAYEAFFMGDLNRILLVLFLLSIFFLVVPSTRLRELVERAIP